MANEIVLYQPNEQMSLEVKLENETVWLTFYDSTHISKIIFCICQKKSLPLQGETLN
jgi:hypothetical protein